MALRWPTPGGRERGTYRKGLILSPMNSPDLFEHGSGNATSDRRLYMQLQVYTDAMPDTIKKVSDTFLAARIEQRVQSAGVEAVVYRDVHDARGIGVLTLAEDPAEFVGPIRDLLAGEPFASLTPRPEYTMLGRTYALGYERDLDETLRHRPRRHALHPDWPWAVWYPVRRSGRFARLPREQQMTILKEHGTIGMQFGQADLAHDVRLACHGLDPHDNDFVIGLQGKDLAGLSKIVETMRATTQTAEYLDNLGPFFVGHAAWKAASPDSTS